MLVGTAVGRMRKDAGFRGWGVVLPGTGLFLFSRLGKGKEWWRGWGLRGWDALMLFHTRAYVNRRPCCQSGGGNLAGGGNPGGGNPGGGNPTGQPWRGNPGRGSNSFLGRTSPAGVARRGFRVNPLLHCALWLAGMHQVWQARSAWQSKQISKR